MKLFVIVLCLLSERYFIHAISQDRFYWFDRYAKKMIQQEPLIKLLSLPWFGLFLLTAPLIFVMALFYNIVNSFLFGLFGLIFQVIVFYYCLGPGNPFYPISTDSNPNDSNQDVEAYFYIVNRQLFSPLCWFLAGGPLGVFAYRLVDLSQNVSFTREKATLLIGILEWIPARIASLLFLLAGNFQRGYVSFKGRLLSPPTENQSLLQTCGIEALMSNGEETTSLPLAQNLVEQAVIIFLVMLAIVTFMSVFNEI